MPALPRLRTTIVQSTQTLKPMFSAKIERIRFLRAIARPVDAQNVSFSGSHCSIQRHAARRAGRVGDASQRRRWYSSSKLGGPLGPSTDSRRGLRKHFVTFGRIWTRRFKKIRHRLWMRAEGRCAPSTSTPAGAEAPSPASTWSQALLAAGSTPTATGPALRRPALRRRLRLGPVISGVVGLASVGVTHRPLLADGVCPDQRARGRPRRRTARGLLVNDLGAGAALVRR